LDIEDYNCYNPESLMPAGATNSITDDNGMEYIVRVETDSVCSGAGEGGADIGANVIYRYGTDGTIWGDSGYDTLSAVSLWPFPNEAKIQSDFRTENVSTSSPTVNNTYRGFCSSGTSIGGDPITLTNYIWEYLGNEIPQDIYHTYYVAINGDDDTGDGSSTYPWQTIGYGIDQLSGGDTLIIKPGLYVGADNAINDIPMGTADGYTTIKAQSDFGVIIGTTSSPCVVSSSYVVIQGIKFFNSGHTDVVYVDGNYVKIIKCASDGSQAEHASFALSGKFGLVEDCYAFGGGRYPFRTYGTDCENSIFRRCVVRWDYSNVTNPYACFANYDTTNVSFQNCIAIDGSDLRGVVSANSGLKAFFTPNGGTYTEFLGCIALNMQGAGYWFEGQPITSGTISNCVAWDIKNNGMPLGTGYGSYLIRSQSDSDGGPLSINHSVFGKTDWGEDGILLTQPIPNDCVMDCIIASVTLNAEKYALISVGLSTESYNRYWGNTSGQNQNSVYGTDTSSMTDVFTSGLKYLVRIETGTALSETGSDGSDIGATILKKTGASGALWGEEGWNIITEENLWPFPNEDQIRTDMAAYSRDAGVAFTTAPALSGTRGFCSTGTALGGYPQTLTRYIFEYLGNQIPADIYNDTGTIVYSDYSNETSTMTFPAPLLSISDLSEVEVSSFSASMEWTNVADIGGLKVERKAVGGEYAVIDTLSLDSTGYVNTGLSAASTYYYRIQSYNDYTTSYSNELTVITEPSPPIPVPFTPEAVFGSRRKNIKLKNCMIK
jgi:hypothetical protein